MLLSFGDIVLVRFPFTNQIAFKQRPAVVVSNSGYHAAEPDAVIMAVTSQFRPSAQLGEVWIADWQGAPLLKASAIKPVFATIEQKLIIKHLGTLQPMDQITLRTAISSVLG